MIGLILCKGFVSCVSKARSDVTGFLSVDEKTIYRLAQQGKLPGFKVAGTWRFQLQDIQGRIDQQILKRDTLSKSSRIIKISS